MSVKHPPSYYDEQASRAIARGDYQYAHDMYVKARTASVGHGRRARYDEAAARCLDLLRERSEVTHD